MKASLGQPSLLKTPFIAVACDLESRQEIIFNKGNLIKAVRASIAIPGVFVPLSYKGKLLMDGAVLQPLPVQPLIRMGVRKIIAVNVLPNQLDVKKTYQK
ncbi:MAG: patatin-like phospholipase family protein [bacterium]